MYLRRQIINRENETKRQDERKFAAARAVLPADLSSICEYAEKSAEVTKMALLMLQGKMKPAHLEVPSLSESVIKNMQKFVESSDERYGDLVHEMLSCYQVQKARLRNMIFHFNNRSAKTSTQVTTTSNIESTIDETISLYLLATNMFEFARKVDEEIDTEDFTDLQIGSAINLLDLRGYISKKHLAALGRVLQKRSNAVFKRKN